MGSRRELSISCRCAHWVDRPGNRIGAIPARTWQCSRYQAVCPWRNERAGGEYPLALLGFAGPTQPPEIDEKCSPLITNFRLILVRPMRRLFLLQLLFGFAC